MVSVSRQIRALLKNNLLSIVKTKTSCCNAIIYPILMTFLTMTLLLRLVSVSDKIGLPTANNTNYVFFDEIDIPKFGDTLALHGCISSKTSCKLGIAPDTPEIREFGNRLSEYLYDHEAGRTAPAVFFSNQSSLDKQLTNSSSEFFAGIYFYTDKEGQTSASIYMGESYLPKMSLGETPLEVTEVSGLKNSTIFVTGGFSTLQQALLKSAVPSSKTTNITLHVKPLPMWGLSWFSTIIALVCGIMHSVLFAGMSQVVLSAIAQEKVNKVREYLFILGTKRVSYWASWGITSFILSFLSSLIFILSLCLFATSSLIGLPLMILNDAGYSIALACFFFLLQSFLNSPVVVTKVAALIMAVPSMLACFFPISVAGHSLLTIIFPTFGYVVATFQFVTISMAGTPVTPIPQIGFFFLFLTSSLVMLALAWYLDKVLPSPYGAKSSPLFIFYPSFWKNFIQTLSGKNKHKPSRSFDYNEHPDGDDDNIDESSLGTSIGATGDINLLDSSSESDEDNDGGSSTQRKVCLFERQKVDDVGIEISRIFKKFTDKDKKGNKTDFYALKDVSAQFCNGKITSLLGENGAGKSTLISVLSGLIGPTSGTALVNGFDIISDMDSVRGSLGVCAQDNIFFPSLSVRQHLELVAAIKNVQKPANDVVHEVMDLCGLDADHENVAVESLSGGMKRKLSLGMALVGNPKILFLDEPTSGVDAVSKRAIWSSLEKIKKDKTILLTTHSMEEADALSDYIYILHEGKLCSGGSPMFLKNNCGVGSYLNIDIKSQDNVGELDSLVTSTIKNAVLDNQSPTMRSYRLPLEETSSYYVLFELLDDPATKDKLGINSYGVSLCTMDDVFVKMCSAKKNDEGDSSSDATRSSSSFALSSDSKDEPACVWQQLVALVKAKLSWYIRDLPAFATVVFAPLLEMILLCFILFMSQSMINSRETKVYDTQLSSFSQKTFPYVLNKTYINDIDQSLVMPLLNSVSNKFSQNFTFKEFDSLEQVETNLTMNSGVLKSKEGIAYALRIDRLNKVSNTAEFTLAYNQSLVTSMVFFEDVVYRSAAEVLTGSKINFSSVEKLNVLHVDILQEASGISAFSAMMVFMSIFMILFVALKPLEQIILERNSGFKDQLFIAGMKPISYVLATVIADAVVVIPAILISLIILASFGYLPSYVVLPFLVACLLFSFASAAFNLFYSYPFKKNESATAVYVTLSVSLTALPLILYILIEIVLVAGSSIIPSGLDFLLRVISFLFELIPLFAFFISAINFFTVPEGVPATFVWSWKSRFCLDLLALVLDTIFYIVLCYGKEYKRISLDEPEIRTGDDVFVSNDEEVRKEYKRVNDIRDDDDGDSTSLDESRVSLKVRRLGKIYTDGPCPVLAVEDVSFASQENECFGLLGPNGSGKTTTMSIITAKLSATYGSVSIGGNLLGRNRVSFYDKSMIGNCPQEEGLLGYLTGRDHLRVMCSMRNGAKPREIDAYVNKALRAVGLDEHADKKSGKYSGGMLRKLNVATALLEGSRFVVLDEPSTGMDVISRRKLWDALKKTRMDSGHSVLLTTHSMEEAESVCTRISIMLKGQLSCIGSIQSLKAKFSNGYVVSFVIDSDKKEELRMDTLEKIAQDCSSDPKTKPELLSVSETSSAVRVTFKIHDVPPLHQFFKTLEDARTSSNGLISQYLVNQSSLESIFVQLVEEHEKDVADLPQPPAKDCCC